VKVSGDLLAGGDPAGWGRTGHLRRCRSPLGPPLEAPRPWSTMRRAHEPCFRTSPRHTIRDPPRHRPRQGYQGKPQYPGSGRSCTRGSCLGSRRHFRVTCRVPRVMEQAAPHCPELGIAQSPCSRTQLSKVRCKLGVLASDFPLRRQMWACSCNSCNRASAGSAGSGGQRSWQVTGR
jgi:hypothetical protein